MARIFIVDGAGARAGDLEAARQRFDDANREAFGADLDVNAHTPQNQIAGINALVATELGEELVRAALYGASVNHARGAFLDALGSLLDIEREQQTKSRAIATLTGVAGTVVPAGRFAKNTAGDTFESETEAIIRDGGTNVSFVAVEYGPKDVSARSLTQIVSAQTGWEGITNAEEGIIGRDTESDALYRANIKARTAQSSVGSISALESALRASGASRVRILENSTASAATISGVLIPAHSILVIADGGLVDDISRAVENHRGMGVNTYTVEQGGAVNLSEAQKIRNGRMVFNGNTISGFDFNGQNINGIVTALNAVAPSGVSYAASGNSILTQYSWRPDATGYEDVGGNIFESGALIGDYSPTATANGTSVRLAFPSPIRSLDASDITIRYTSGGSQQTSTISSVNTFASFADVTITPAMPSAAQNISVAISDISSNIVSELNIPQTTVANTTEGATDAPVEPIVYGEPRNGGVSVWGMALGTVTKWQYRRFDGGTFLDSDWVDVPLTETPTRRRLSGSTPSNGYTITGFTNNNTCRLDLRAVNGGHGSTATRSIVFVPSNTAPTLQSQRVDGEMVTLTYNAPLTPSVVDSGLSYWSVTGKSVTKQTIRGSRVYLTLNSAIDQGATATIAYTQNADGPRGTNGVQAAAFAARTLAVDSITGIPSVPIDMVAYQTRNGYNFQWEPNSDGGLAIDKYEYSTRAEGTNTWSAWIDLASSARLHQVIATGTPANIRIRASNPNARGASILQLTGHSDVYPFARSIARPLVVEVQIYRDATITTSDFAAIKTSLIDLINSYPIGATLWQADLQARVESLQSIRLASPLTVTSAGIPVSGIEQNAYNRWTLAEDDITITFVN